MLMPSCFISLNLVGEIFVYFSLLIKLFSFSGRSCASLHQYATATTKTPSTTYKLVGVFRRIKGTKAIKYFLPVGLLSSCPSSARAADSQNAPSQNTKFFKLALQD